MDNTLLTIGLPAVLIGFACLALMVHKELGPFAGLNVAGRWLHNGAVDKLEEVVRIMAIAQLGRSGKLNAWLNDDHQLGKTDRSPLGDKEVADLVAFLEALSSERLVAGAGKGRR